MARFNWRIGRSRRDPGPVEGSADSGGHRDVMDGLQERLDSLKRQCDRLAREVPGTEEEQQLRARAAQIEVQLEQLRATLAEFDRADPSDSAR